MKVEQYIEGLSQEDLKECAGALGIRQEQLVAALNIKKACVAGGMEFSGIADAVREMPTPSRSNPRIQRITEDELDNAPAWDGEGVRGDNTWVRTLDIDQKTARTSRGERNV